MHTLLIDASTLITHVMQWLRRLRRMGVCSIYSGLMLCDPRTTANCPGVSAVGVTHRLRAASRRSRSRCGLPGAAGRGATAGVSLVLCLMCMLASKGENFPPTPHSNGNHTRRAERAGGESGPVKSTAIGAYEFVDNRTSLCISFYRIILHMLGMDCTQVVKFTRSSRTIMHTQCIAMGQPCTGPDAASARTRRRPTRGARHAI